MHRPFVSAALLALATGLATPALHAQLGRGDEAPVVQRQHVDEFRKEEAPAESEEMALRFLHAQRVALGGSEALDRIVTLRRAGTVQEGRNLRNVVETFRLPFSYRIEERWKDQGRDYLVVTATDGRIAWRQEVLPTPSRPEELGAGEVERLKAMADFRGPLLAGPQHGWKFTYRGPARIRTRPGFMVTGFAPDGRREFFYFDAQTYLCTRIGGREKFAGQEADMDRYITKFTRAGNVYYPQIIEDEATGRVYRRIEWLRIEPNVTVEDALFLPPPQREVILRQAPEKP